MNLNALQAGTNYSYTVEVESTGSTCYASYSTHSGSFSTSGAPTNEFVGWAYDVDTNAYQILQEGSAASGVNINVTATCQMYGNYGELGSPGQVVFFDNVEEGANPDMITGSSGYYAFAFPLYEDAPAGNLGDIQGFALSAGGNCETTDYSESANYANSNLLITAGGYAGEWTDQIYSTASMSAQNDYRSFVLDANPLGYTAAALSLVHTSASECETSFTTTSTQTVEALAGGTGNSQIHTQQTTYGGAYPGWGNDSGVSLGWQVAGVMNDTSATPISAWPESWESTAAVPYTTTDWIGDTAFNLGDPASPYLAIEIPTNYQKSNPYPLVVTQTTTYSSTTGTELDVDVGVNFAVVSVGVSVPLTYTTTDVYTTSPTLGCQFYDPSSTQTAVFYYTFNGGATALADVIHIWLAGYCPVGESKC